jgi:hypothetical protein
MFSAKARVMRQLRAAESGSIVLVMTCRYALWRIVVALSNSGQTAIVLKT